MIGIFSDSYQVVTLFPGNKIANIIRRSRLSSSYEKKYLLSIECK